jgi:adenylosuccinate synthase
VLLEGAQGTMLDLDKGTYPFVTSSNPVAGYALASVGIGPREVERVIGITKAYVTRVGAGPFPTEDTGPEGERLGERGREFGTVTGRKRRCGWFDAVIARYAARVNGLTELFVTKLDVLSGFESVKVCTAYRAEETLYEDVPSHQSLFHAAEPVYEELEGWDEDLAQVRAFAELPAAARKYLDRLQDLAGVPIGVVSVGPGREQSLSADATSHPDDA